MKKGPYSDLEEKPLKPEFSIRPIVFGQSPLGGDAVDSLGRKNKRNLHRLEAINSTSASTQKNIMSSSLQFGVTMSYRDMERPYSAPTEKFPKHVVSSVSQGESGITFSIEKIEGSAAEGQAELDVLKAIVNREEYLKKLFLSVRTIQKKFKPEVSDLLDIIRITSIDVIEAIVRWREVKNDHDAIFTWNGMNYLLKMPSDLDYLDEYRAVKKWVGFSLIRNPFAVPFPLEEGIDIFAGLSSSLAL